MSHEPKDDTLRMLMTDAREKLAAVTQTIERGRITKNSRAIKTHGPWCLGPLYKNDLIEIILWVAPRITSEAPPIDKYTRQATYIGVAGSANIHMKSGYMRVGQGTAAHMILGDVHRVEPIEDNTQLLLILIGEQEQDK